MFFIPNRNTVHFNILTIHSICHSPVLDKSTLFPYRFTYSRHISNETSHKVCLFFKLTSFTQHSIFLGSSSDASYQYFFPFIPEFEPATLFLWVPLLITQQNKYFMCSFAYLLKSCPLFCNYCACKYALTSIFYCFQFFYFKIAFCVLRVEIDA